MNVLDKIYAVAGQISLLIGPGCLVHAFRRVRQDRVITDDFHCHDASVYAPRSITALCKRPIDRTTHVHS